MYAEENADYVIKVPKGKDCPDDEVSVCFRPFLHEFLKDMQSKFEIIIYSSFSSSYLNSIIDLLEKTAEGPSIDKYFIHRFSEEFCIFANISYSVKCIDFLLGNRTSADIIVVENTITTFPLSTDNVIPIPAYSGKNPGDSELIKLSSILDALIEEPDVRQTIKKYRGEA